METWRSSQEINSLMEDVSSYFRKWKEWRNTNLGNKSSISIKGVENDRKGTTN